MGIQKNCLEETVLFEHPKHMFKLMDKKIISILCKLFLLNWPYVGTLSVHKTLFLMGILNLNVDTCGEYLKTALQCL